MMAMTPFPGEQPKMTFGENSRPISLAESKSNGKWARDSRVHQRCQRLEIPIAFLLFLQLVLAGGKELVAAEAQTNAGPDHLLLYDRFGNALRAPTNSVDPSLHPPASVGLEKQIPSAPKGTPQSEEAGGVSAKASEVVNGFPRLHPT
jgi:hypothetical protein